MIILCILYVCTVKPLIKDSLGYGQPLYKGQKPLTTNWVLVRYVCPYIGGLSVDMQGWSVCPL